MEISCRSPEPDQGYRQHGCRVELLPGCLGSLRQAAGLDRVLVSTQVGRVLCLPDPPQQCAIQSAFQAGQAPASLCQRLERDAFQGVAVRAEDILSQPAAHILSTFAIIRPASASLPALAAMRMSTTPEWAVRPTVGLVSASRSPTCSSSAPSPIPLTCSVRTLMISCRLNRLCK